MCIAFYRVTVKLKTFLQTYFEVFMKIMLTSLIITTTNRVYNKYNLKAK